MTYEFMAMTSRDIYFYVAGLGTAVIVTIGVWWFRAWRDYREWRQGMGL